VRYPVSLLASAVLAASSAPACGAQRRTEDAAIREIRARYGAVTRERARLRCRLLDLEGFSAEGGELRACYDSTGPALFTARYFGEAGRAIEEFVFQGGEVVFVLRRDERYTEPLSGVVSHIREDRFYFRGGRLVRWIGPGRRLLPLAGVEAREQERDRLETARTLAACAADSARGTCAP